MNEDALFPPYISRPEEEQIRAQVAIVREQGTSRVVLLYGEGGVGKTYLVREMARAAAGDATSAWFEPIDVDDSEYWLLSNLEREIARHLDPDNKYFERYRDYMARLPDYAHPRIGRVAVVSHLGRIKRVFVDCYTEFVERTGKTVVLAFDTVEALRGTYLLVTLTQWMKALPGTLFILSGRPMPDHIDNNDPIRNEFAGPHKRLPIELIRLDAFEYDGALRYVNNSGIAGSLNEDEPKKLVHLTGGHPLWLAAAISYLANRDMPEEADPSLADIAAVLPYGEEPGQRGKNLQEAFRRRLVTPYRELDFWHEAVTRLAVLRQAVNAHVWQQLMGDRRLPRGVPSLEEAWKELQRIPWIRPRANGRYVTLHDAMAEELAKRIIPVQDQDQRQRHELWDRAIAIYAEMIDDIAPRLDEEQRALDERLRLLDERVQVEGEERHPPAAEIDFIQSVARLDADKRELDQFRAARLFYQLLSDFEAGCQLFLSLFEVADRRGDFFFQELLALEMHRFLPGGVQRYTLGDVVGRAIAEFREWLPSRRPGLYRDIGIIMSAYLILDEQPEIAIELLDALPMTGAGGTQLYRIEILRGNAHMRIPGQVRGAERHFRAALNEANLLTSEDGPKLIAQAYKELGFYFRNEGMWKSADEAYRNARDAISSSLSVRDSDADREELASIHTNWAYVKGLTGDYRDGSNLVESAIEVRHRLTRYYDEGISWSVYGEVYRYERRFEKAWDAYSTAEQIFHGERSWTWLGVIYQEQAICLFQAMQDGINLHRDPLDRAKQLISLSLDICRDQAIRNYPSALNRAGRIFGYEDTEAGLVYLADGIDWARRLSDGWFWFANLVEYVELCYRAWAKTPERSDYLDAIATRELAIREAMTEYEFPDLRGRWYLVRGHLDVHRWEETGDDRLLRSALGEYRAGFALIAQAYVGSSGASALQSEFRTFSQLFSRLPQNVRAEWQNELRRGWRDLPDGSTMLLARLEALH
jgi:tetratricopeptide (TPR) repeat protein